MKKTGFIHSNIHEGSFVVGCLGNFILLFDCGRSIDHCFAAFLQQLNNSKKLRRLMKPNLFALTDSC